MSGPSLAAVHPKLSRVRRYVLENGERFTTAVAAEGVHAYYATCYLLRRRSRSITAETMADEAHDLVHLDQRALREGVDLDARIERGEYPAHSAAENDRAYRRIEGLPPSILGTIVPNFLINDRHGAIWERSHPRTRRPHVR